MGQLSKLKTRLDVNDKDDLLIQLLDDAEACILDYTSRSALLPAMEGLQRDLAVEYYNRLGAEGLTSRSEGAISESYGTEIPSLLKSRLNRYRRANLAGIANGGGEDA